MQSANLLKKVLSVYLLKIRSRINEKRSYVYESPNLVEKTTLAGPKSGLLGHAKIIHSGVNRILLPVNWIQKAFQNCDVNIANNPFHKITF